MSTARVAAHASNECTTACAFRTKSRKHFREKLHVAAAKSKAAVADVLQATSQSFVADGLPSSVADVLHFICCRCIVFTCLRLSHAMRVFEMRVRYVSSKQVQQYSRHLLHTFGGHHVEDFLPLRTCCLSSVADMFPSVGSKLMLLWASSFLASIRCTSACGARQPAAFSLQCLPQQI